jgi:NADH:ubiquinone oxidoreductase subunit H
LKEYNSFPKMALVVLFMERFDIRQQYYQNTLFATGPTYLLQSVFVALVVAPIQPAGVVVLPSLGLFFYIIGSYPL